MFHFILIVGFVLLPKVATLKCYECLAAGDCNKVEKQCPASSSRCEAVRVTSYVGSAKAAEVNLKSCSEPEQCIEGSINFGISRTVMTSKCCSSDLCNTQSAPEPIPLSIPNGKKCYTCNAKSCKVTLNCEGSEDHCISTSVTFGGQKMTMKGCASKRICANTNNKQLVENIGADLSCCQGNYCNGAGSTSASLLLLVAPLIPLMIFS
ncbi:urokinase plasminogen activator surface receptor-like [Takifugu flavidus]|uniref:urokinase plasminogen activator surface receptor-like n=1 Tax=Takifugu flavidus TaxID=433684 RepID=UPI0025446CF4|nr:urokinase plasminogen activator surface receptor-like [Takifugu flavidus]